MSAPRTRVTATVTVLAAAALLSAGVVGCSRKADPAAQNTVNMSEAIAQSGDEAAVGGAAGGTNAGTESLAPHAAGDGIVNSSDAPGMTPPTGGQASPST
jgi:hypothetical protein